MGTVGTIICYVVMALGLIGMIWALKNQRKNPNAQTFAVISMIVVVISAVCVLNPFGLDPELDRIESNSAQFEKAKTKSIADFVNANFQGKKIILLIDSNMLKENSAVKKNVEDFKKMVSVTDTVVIDVPDPDKVYNPESNNPPVMPEEVVTAKLLNEKLDKFKDADVIVNFIGLPNPPSAPGDFHRLKCLKQRGDKCKMVLWNDQALYEAGHYLFNGRIAAAVITNPATKFDFLKDSAPGDLKEAFDTRYVLLTQKNFVEFAKANPGMFIE